MQKAKFFKFQDKTADRGIGGIAEMERRNREKAQMLYDFIDSSKLFSCPVAKEDRSLMNVVFVTGDAELDKKFIALAKENGMINLSGHRSIAEIIQCR